MTHHDPDANVTMPQGTENDGRGKPSDGGQAFPMPASETSMGGHFEKYGMTLRQWYAGKALATLREYGPNDKAELAFAIADAMIAFEAQEGGEK